MGGPIKRDHTFFFANWEQLTFITAPVDVLLLPSTSYEAGVLGSDGNRDNPSSSLYAAGVGSACAFYTKAFSLYNNVPGHASATAFSADQLELTAAPKTELREHLLNVRIDQTFSENDKLFAHYKYDKGTQPTYADPFTPDFDMQSIQPDDEGQMSWTHVFSPRAVNQFLLTGAWYSAIFTAANQTAATALMPETLNFGDLDGYFADLNHDNFAFPQGRNVSQVQIGDDFSFSSGRHTWKAGLSFKKNYVSDHDMTAFSTPLVLTCGSETSCTSAIGADYGNLFGEGISLEAIQSLPRGPTCRSACIRLANTSGQLETKSKFDADPGSARGAELKPQLPAELPVELRHGFQHICSECWRERVCHDAVFDPGERRAEQGLPELPAFHDRASIRVHLFTDLRPEYGGAGRSGYFYRRIPGHYCGYGVIESST